MKLVIINDNVNTVNHVMDVLNSCLAYPKTQIISIVSLVDTTGKCTILESDDASKINDVKEFLIKNGLTVEVE